MPSWPVNFRSHISPLLAQKKFAYIFYENSKNLPFSCSLSWKYRGKAKTKENPRIRRWGKKSTPWVFFLIFSPQKKNNSAHLWAAGGGSSGLSDLVNHLTRFSRLSFKNSIRPLIHGKMWCVAPWFFFFFFFVSNNIVWPIPSAPNNANNKSRKWIWMGEWWWDQCEMRSVIHSTTKPCLCIHNVDFFSTSTFPINLFPTTYFCLNAFNVSFLRNHSVRVRVQQRPKS